jgi:hypothetical protein
MQIKMIRTEYGQDTDEKGIARKPQKYREGETYDVSDSLGQVLINMGSAASPDSLSTDEDVEVQPEKTKAGRKRMGGAPENKSA